jgi:hypothetical protein
MPMSNVLPFPMRHTELTESERAAGLLIWQQALEATPMRADLCIECSCPTSSHVDASGRHRGCAFALILTRGRMS